MSSIAPIVDAHHHFWWEPSPQDYPWMTHELTAIRRTFGPEELRPLLTACGVDHSVLVQTRSSLEETKRFLALAAVADFVAGVVGWVDLTAPDVGATLRDLQSGEGGRYLKAIRHQVHDEPDPGWLLRDSVLRGLRAVEEAGLAYDLLLRPRELPAACEVARALPRLRFVVDHIGKPPIRTGRLDGWDVGMADLADCENVSCKLSGMVTEASWSSWTLDDLRPYVARVLDWFGPDRLMFGSDWPVCLLAASYGEVYATCLSAIEQLSAGDRERILGRTAITFYRLDV